MMDNYDPRRLGQGPDLPPDKAILNVYGEGKYPSTARKAAEAFQKKQEDPPWVKLAKEREAQRLAEEKTITPLHDTIHAITEHHERPEGGGHSDTFMNRFKQAAQEANQDMQRHLDQNHTRDR